MKGLLILIPVATVILIILLIIKRKREAMYKERRKFWLQDVGKSILYAAYDILHISSMFVVQQRLSQFTSRF